MSTFSLTHIQTLLTMDVDGTDGPLVPSQIQPEHLVIEDAFVTIKEGVIHSLGPMKDYISTETEFSCQGKTVMPGLVDPHTHLIFAGSREHELVSKIQASFQVSKGDRMSGGINYTVSQTRQASLETLTQLALKRLDRMLAHGTTTAEAKSGYGLDLDNEIKSLEAIQAAHQQHAIDLVPTFLGAHAVPPEHSKDSYVQAVLEMLPVVAERQLAEFCDIFCEEGFFTPDDSYAVLGKAKELGFKLKIHADELANSGGSKVAAELGAYSADHLQFAPEAHLRAMKDSGVIPTLLPGTAFYLGLPYADAARMRQMDIPMALSTDLNPGGCNCESQIFMVVLACTQMKMLPLEAWVGVTRNAAYAIARGDSAGILKPGRAADIVVFDAPNHNYIPYHFGVNLIEKVFKAGRQVV